MATKIKEILDCVPKDSVLFSSWLSSRGLDRKEQSMYVKSGWLERVATGVYKLDGNSVSLYGAVSSYDTQLGKHCHVGALSALDLRGYSHFIPMRKPQAFLFTPTGERLPSWIFKTGWDMTIRYFTTSIFEGDSGLETIDYRGYNLLVSSPERAFMECLHLAPENYSLMDLFYVMEMLTTLRPKLVQSLLEKCSSIKVKRLFLYMAEKAGHQWFKAIDATKLDLGKGDRQLADDGTYISKYKIIIPKELSDYE